MNMLTAAGAAIAVVFGAVSAAQAATVDLDASSRGCVIETGAYGCGNSGLPSGNVLTGHHIGHDYRSFFVFDLSALSGTVASATFSLQLDNQLGYDSPDASEFLAFFALSEDSINKLLADTPDVGVFDDMGTGINLGGPSLTAADNGTIVTFALGPLWIDAINAALGGNLGVGGLLASYSGVNPEESVLGASLDQMFRLSLNFEETTAVPLPAALPLFIAGLGGLGFAGRRRKAA
ncbi:MAG: VPLPA-CTERM sorting domain-containing protein [Parvularculaceae bacterium]